MPGSTNNQLGFQPAAIEAQLERIVSSDRFLVAEQRSRFLRFVVAETLAGRLGLLIVLALAVTLILAWLRHRFLPRKDLRKARHKNDPSS